MAMAKRKEKVVNKRDRETEREGYRKAKYILEITAFPVTDQKTGKTN